MKIHLSSDLHLYRPELIVEPINADVGIFAGDIGILKTPGLIIKYFNEMRHKYTTMIWVLGNHEFYGMDYFEALDIATKIAEQCDVILMDIAFGTENLEIDGVTFWGSTLWTDFRDCSPLALLEAERYINDFRVIDVADRQLKALDAYQINKETRVQINWDADVIISHFAPILVENPRYNTTDISYYFSNTGLEEQILESNIKLWLYGHTHYNTDITYNNTRIVSNCFGYQNELNDYNKDLILEVD